MCIYPSPSSCSGSSKASLRLLVILLLLSLEGGLGNTVQITLAGLCDAAATLVLIDLYDADLLEGLEDLAVDGAGGIDVVRGARAAVLGGTAQMLVCPVLFRSCPYCEERPTLRRGGASSSRTAVGRCAYPWTLRRRPTPTVLRM
jgi:hypothetical protein